MKNSMAHRALFPLAFNLRRPVVVIPEGDKFKDSYGVYVAAATEDDDDDNSVCTGAHAKNKPFREIH